jgi:hypothetical protein
MWDMIISSANIYASFMRQSFSRVQEHNNIRMECSGVRYDFKRNPISAQSLSRMLFNWRPGGLEVSVPLDGMFGEQTMVRDSRLLTENDAANDVIGWRYLCLVSVREAVVFCFSLIDLHSAGPQRGRHVLMEIKPLSCREKKSCHLPQSLQNCYE